MWLSILTLKKMHGMDVGMHKTGRFFSSKKLIFDARLGKTPTVLYCVDK
jgi:hypothetical protein